MKVGTLPTTPLIIMLLCYLAFISTEKAKFTENKIIHRALENWYWSGLFTMLFYGMCVICHLMAQLPRLGCVKLFEADWFRFLTTGIAFLMLSGLKERAKHVEETPEYEAYYERKAEQAKQARQQREWERIKKREIAKYGQAAYDEKQQRLKNIRERRAAIMERKK